jgi:hypothetical protein
MIIVDQYSFSTVPIEMHFDTVDLAVGTAFIYKIENAFFLITNWHNLSGRDPSTGKCLSKTGAVPNNIHVWFVENTGRGHRIMKQIPIRDPNGKPLWFVHPTHKQAIDVVALPIKAMSDVELKPINEMPNEDLVLEIGMDVFVLGYPFGMGVAGLPVWKRGSIASEPALSPQAQLNWFLDTASRPGMSGSPVVRRSWGNHILANGSMNISTGSATKFLGVYSGRLASSDPLDAQLGLMWPAAFIPEIISGRQVDT